jgi:hypothetical protein
MSTSGRFWLSRLVGGTETQPARQTLTDRLADSRRYEAQIDRLHQRHLFDGGMHWLRQDGVTLATLVLHRVTAARKIALAVSSGTYQLQPASVRRIRVDGKKRAVFDYPLLDLVVHGVVAEVLTQALEPTLAPNLYSYRRGISWAQGVSSFARFVRAHRRAHPDPRTRGLYVLRRDVDSYTDSIPVGASSRLWPLLNEVLGEELDSGPLAAARWDQEPSWRLLHEVVQPRVRVKDGRIEVRERGVATGQPISCVAFNLYLRDLDRELAAIPGAYVARYSDDLLFAHPDAQVAREVSNLLDRRLAELDLRFNQGKSRDLYLTGAGRPSPDWPEARGTTSVEFLGMRIGMDGAVALGDRKVRAFLRDARRRVRNAARVTRGRPEGERGRALAAVTNALLDQDQRHLAGAAASLLARVVTDRAQLDWLDHQLARMVAGALSDDPGAAAFRQIPYHRIRAEWGLVSLRRARDRGP